MKMASRLIDLISIKTNCTGSTLFLLISKKKNLHVRHVFLSFPCRCFARLQRCLVRLKRQTSRLHIIFMEELSYVFTQYFVSCVHVCFYFSLPLIFSLLTACISHFVSTATNFHVVLPTKICLLCFFISRSKSLSPFFSLSFAGLPTTFSFSLCFSFSIFQICGHDN